ncbi:MAG TPA: NUDIX domain-containing protein [Chitinophagaceae bacterium]|nr:NUDIX domain-containing protein [Chitinophagaceae bacterium]
MKKFGSLADFILEGDRHFLPALSLDNVIFGFHDNQLKVLLLQLKTINKWILPGGFIFKTEEIEDAALRILQERTGLKEIYLQQFHVFGSKKRNKQKFFKDLYKEMGVELTDNSWILQRFLTLGFYALVEFEKVRPHADDMSAQISWWEVSKLPDLMFDHKEIIETALKDMRLKINNQPIGYNLLPKEFTLKNLQSIYETILDRKLDRANFNRKILSYGILDKKEKQYTGGAHKAPYLYSFNKQAYFKALQEGLEKNF